MNNIGGYDSVLVRPKGNGAVRLVVDQSELEYSPQSGYSCPLSCDP